MTVDLIEKAEGCLLGLALGDALGAPTQSLSPQQIISTYGRITHLRDASADQPIAPNLPAGRVTDDTDQALIVAHMLVQGLSAPAFAQALLDWEDHMIAIGSLDLLGPSTKAALYKIREGGDLTEAGKYGSTNGSTMRIAPVGIAYPPGQHLRESVCQISSLTHGTTIGISAAMTVAVTISNVLEGAALPEALAAGIAEGSKDYGNWVAGASIPARFKALWPLCQSMGEEEFSTFLQQVVGTSVQSPESVTAALLLACKYADKPFTALCAAANLGGDTDTIGAIAGAILGALHGPAGFPPSQIGLVEEVNEHDFAGTAEKLLAPRKGEQ